MGTWDTGILDDDLAQDIKAEFDEAMNTSNAVNVATEVVLEAFSDCLEDEDEEIIVVLTLAYLQAQRKCLQESVKQRTLEIIDSGEGLERWEENEALLTDRKNALEELKQLILNQESLP